MADGGAFTDQQLSKLKTRKQTTVESGFQWRRKHTVFVCGGSYAYQCRSMLRVGGADIVYFEKDEDGYDTLSLNIYDNQMNKKIEMRKNDWMARSDAEDIEAPPSAKSLRLRYPACGINIDIEFKDRTLLSNSEKNIAIEFMIPADENLLFCYFNGTMPAPLPVTFSPTSVKFRGITLQGARMANCGVGIQVG